ncbi:MAG: dihydropteroate synthase [Gordonibacter sp.]|uniref:dihydropteroate synthase n=1 Tax=Gordonibacter sp. TaxID=1968902 RepID=UPI002FC77199
MIWRCATHEFDTKMPVVMGILNVTPDSFSDGGEHEGFEAALAHAERMVEEGAALIDVGGESTRPGAAAVTVEEELVRTIPVVEALSKRGMCVSIDTRHASVARAAVEAGASVINDISGFCDAAMVDVARASDVGLVVMHMQGDPSTMQDDPVYADVVGEVRDYLRDRAAALETSGIARERICVDPGPGFGKTAKQTIELVRNFQEFVRLGYPVMAALSRKSYLGYAYKIDEPRDRDQVSAAEALMACELGASIVRAHNVGETVKALKDLRPYAVLGLGCNVALVAHPGEEREGKIALLNQAITELCSLPDSQIIDISSFYESEPAYYLDQDVFVNAVILMRTGLAPKELLKYLQAIENSLGRVREIENGPRTCDLDIIDYQLYVTDNDLLTLPHPRALERDFVVKPLMELLPGHVLANDVPVTGEAVTVGKAFKL